ncbi:unnamed protein product [Cylindrotheca closterium]|uniref:Reverse transcriptase domain-containing protein n=1 Tax=Cylindrotheca closterium TaxID=2856 RepID=A0AAD2GC79_9STRA|nr:unnamed protein product [Cylindrotheca closterium]
MSVEDGCMQENRARYQQTQTPHPTPPMSEPLYTMFTGPDADNNQQLLLEGKLPISAGLAYPTQAFLRHCRLHDSYRSRPFPLTVEEHVDFWSGTPENKGSEPHGLHNGHFKAGALLELLVSCDTAFWDLPLRSGHVPELWKNLMNFAIEKKPGDFRPQGMRTIQLFNSEAQANYKKAGRAAMKNAEEDDIIPKGQCGSRKQHQSIDLALSKRLIWDSLILERQSSGWISNDAKSCFDRIVHWVAKTALRRFGLPVTVTNLMFDILAKAKHRVRTGFGDSARTFGPTGDVPFQGCGQGNGAGPCIWVAISTILIDAMEAEGFGYKSRTALTNKEFFALCFCFVDDTDVMESNDNVETTGEDLLPLVQSALDLWSGGISATGGAINPAKSFWWLIDFNWRPSSGTWVFRRKAEMPGKLTLQDPTGPWATLRRLQPDEAERTLGVMMAPLETGTAQHLALREKAKNWAAKFRPQHLLPYDVLPLLKATALKTLEYVMPLSTLGRSDWVSIMSPILQASLHKAGVCRSFPRVVVFVPLKYQGLGIPHPFALQVFHHLSVLMRHSAHRTKTGQYLEANLQSHQLETGTSCPLLQQEPTNTGILASETWLKRVWIELDSLGIRVKISSPPLSLHCTNDRLLMDIFIDALVDQEDLLWLIWCRQYLQVTTLSELTTADGCSLTAASLAGQPSGHFVTSYNWPRTRRPGPSHWDLWRRVLSQAVLRPYSRRRRLLQPLGPWSDSLDRWTWLFSRTALILFHRTDKNLAIYRPINSRSHKTFRRDLHHTWTGTLPGDVQRASVNLHPRTAYVTVTGTAPVDPPDQESLPASILHIWRELAADMDDDWGWVSELTTASFSCRPTLRTLCDQLQLAPNSTPWPLLLGPMATRPLSSCPPPLQPPSPIVAAPRTIRPTRSPCQPRSFTSGGNWQPTWTTIGDGFRNSPPPASLAGQPSGHFVTSYNWPRTRRPGPSYWDLWRRVLSQAVLRPYSRRRRLLQPLGPWSDSLDRWTWLFSRTALILFHRTDKNLAIYRPINPRSHKTFRRDLHHTWTGTLPGDVQRASVNLHPRTAYVTVTGTAPVDPPDQESLPASILHIWRELAADMDDDWGWVSELTTASFSCRPTLRTLCDQLQLAPNSTPWPLLLGPMATRPLSSCPPPLQPPSPIVAAPRTIRPTRSPCQPRSFTSGGNWQPTWTTIGDGFRNSPPPASLAGQPSGHFVTSYNWPRTRRPGPSYWDLWRRVLSQAVLRPYSRRRRLLQPLGPWSDSLDRWTWLFSRTALILFHRTDNNLAIYRPINTRSHKTFRRDLHHTWTGALPGDVQRASVNLHPRTAYVTVTGTAPVDPPDQESLPASILHIWRELAADMDDDWGWVPEYIYIEGDKQVLLEALEKGKLRVISDGSFKQQVGTAAVQL